MFVCVAGKNDISVNVLQTLFEKRIKTMNWVLYVIKMKREKTAGRSRFAFMQENVG